MVSIDSESEVPPITTQAKTAPPQIPWVGSNLPELVVIHSRL